jgi:hypothetical protein
MRIKKNIEILNKEAAMKKMILLALALAVLLLSLPYNLPAKSQTPAETRVTGTLHLGSMPVIQPNETGYWLRSDQPIYVLKGSKSEASTDIVVLRVPADLLEKTRKLNGRHVVAVGLMNCTGKWPAGANCNMLVKQIGIADTRCDLKPDGGPCKALFWKYYYNPTTKKCEKFVYGGCGGVVPFETKEECRGMCEGKEDAPR